MSSIVATAFRKYDVSSGMLQHLAFLLLLSGRAYVAWVFFKSGLTKVRDWDTTLLLFEWEYSVPLIGHELAAWMATTGELVLPVMLVVGLASRFSAAGLFIVNAVAVISLAEIPPAALYLHYIWGLLLLQIMVWGGGILSLDKLISRLGFSANEPSVEAGAAYKRVGLAS
ncbi:MAG: DoxX family protein [Halieaceae bacterium]|jgi:putative oxidoreductase|nr:DoxX family protein [Halieaceae bacterium]